MSSLRPYDGPVRKLVLGIDIGTTYSGISYAFLDPGKIPKIHSLNNYPAQEGLSEFKIPSIMYYRPDGTVHSIGAEAAIPGIELDAEDEDLFYVQWFKLHLRPAHFKSLELSADDLRPLPPGKTILQVFGDFLKYLFGCAKKSISEAYEADKHGNLVWDSVKDSIDFVLGHPNGWEGLQQAKMREAAVLGGLIPDTPEGRARVHFVSEGEASLQFCIRNNLEMEGGKTVMIIDAGGGTVDISSYSCVSTTPQLVVEEVAPAECILQGSTRVNLRAERFLRARLANSQYGTEADIKTMVDNFNVSVKPGFKPEDARVTTNTFIKFGSVACNDPQVKIRRGQLALTGEEMESFFTPSLDGIVNAIERQCRLSTRSITTAFLVGGFAASPWLFAKLQERFKLLGLTLYKPNTHTSKAVSEGAVAYYLDRSVTARVMKATYGTECAVAYDPSKPEHAPRSGAKVTRSSGRVVLSGAFSSILCEGTLVHEKQEMSRSFFRDARQRDDPILNKISADIISYRDGTAPNWLDEAPDKFTRMCTVDADISQVARTSRTMPNGEFFVQVFKVVLLCGFTELKALISWEENGEEKRGPATIVYNEDPDSINMQLP
ncbi:hypothetical protein C8Q76DRAFT_801605 [Earliella scabrosa]|nr:hypothetical protein C8Q76DRAFT_801605 [Earliella scabrosa]